MRTDLRIEMLGHRKQQVLRLQSQGYLDKVIAAKLGISVCTVRSHIFKTARLLGVERDRDPRVVVAEWVREQELYKPAA